MANESRTHVDSAEKVEAAITACRSRRGSCRVAFEGPLAKRPDADQLEKRINRDLRACGCSEGTLGMLCGLALGLTLSAAVGVSSTALWVLWPATTALAGLGLGKTLGLRAARKRLERTLNHLRSSRLPDIQN